MSNDIYTYIYQNFNMKITDYIFKRDYIKEPIIGSKIHSKYDLPYKEDLEYLYLTLNFTLNQLSKIFNRPHKAIMLWMKKLDIEKPFDKILNSRVKTCLEKYGVKSYTQTKECQEKIEKTCFERYGVKRYAQKDGWNEEYINFMMKKYGVKNPFQIEDIKEKIEKTCLERYGVMNYSQSEAMREYIRLDSVSQKRKEKENETKRKNNSFSKSKPENDCFELLIKKFPDAVRQYRDERYPFNCDFYIPSKDLFIEYQGDWTHGSHNFHCPYDETNMEHKKEVERMKLKNTDRYLRAIKTWTVLDPIKRKTAKDNGLNWLEFFSVKEFEEWIDRQ